MKRLVGVGQWKIHLIVHRKPNVLSISMKLQLFLIRKESTNAMNANMNKTFNTFAH